MFYLLVREETKNKYFFLNLSGKLRGGGGVNPMNNLNNYQRKKMEEKTIIQQGIWGGGSSRTLVVRQLKKLFFVGIFNTDKMFSFYYAMNNMTGNAINF